jgi:hypothetical protein
MPVYTGTFIEALKPVIAGGRLLYAGALYLAFSQIDDFTTLRLIRYIAVLGISTTVWFVYLFLVNLGWKRVTALIISVILGTIPSFQVHAAWTIAFIFPWGAALAGISVYFLNKNSRSLITRFILSSLILVLSFNIYQPSATYFWVFTVLILFMKSSKLQDKVRVYLIHVSVFFTSALIALLIQKVISRLMEECCSFAVARSNLTTDIVGKLVWFVKGALLDSANLLLLKPSIEFGLFTLVIIVVGFWLYVQGSLKEKCIQMVIALSIIPLSYLPNLVIAENWSSYRTQVGLCSVIIIYFFISLRRILELFRNKFGVILRQVILGFSLFAACVLTMFHETFEFAIPQFIEMSAIQSKIAGSDLSKTKEIVLIPNNWQGSISPLVRYDEFGLPSTDVQWAQIEAVQLALRDLNPAFTNIPIRVIADIKQYPQSTDGILIINLREMSTIRQYFNLNRLQY